MQNQIAHYANKLAFEIDSWDLNEAQKGSTDVVVLDVRSVDAYAREHIPGAISFPHKRMTAENTEALRRDAQYVVYCDGIGCNASTAGAMKMASLGFMVKELMGGLDWWKRSAFPTRNQQCMPETASEVCGCD